MNNEYFTEEELSCSCCNVNNIDENMLYRLTAMRKELNFPFPVTSGYRCPAYNTKMGYTQTHATGHAVDIAVTHEQAFQIAAMAAMYEFTGVGINQKGNSRFIHLDDLTKQYGRPRPHIWSY